MQWMMTPNPTEETFTSRSRVQDPAAGYVLGGRYARVEPLPMAAGEWWRGYTVATAEPVTLRRVALNGPPSETAMAAMRLDIHRVASNLRPYIVRVLDTAIEDRALIIVTEPRGERLADLLQRRRLTLEEALTYGRHLTSALSYAHTHHVAHGLLTPAAIDWEPANDTQSPGTSAIIRAMPANSSSSGSSHGSSAGASYGTARLGDFGLVHLTSAICEALPHDGALRQGYRAPEERRGSEGNMASDLFHLGALLWELCLGTPPPMEDPITARHLLASLPIELQELILTCIQPDPRQRPQHLDLVMTELRAIQRTFSGYHPRPDRHAISRVPRPNLRSSFTARDPIADRDRANDSDTLVRELPRNPLPAQSRTLVGSSATQRAQAPQYWGAQTTPSANIPPADRVAARAVSIAAPRSSDVRPRDSAKFARRWDSPKPTKTAQHDLHEAQNLSENPSHPLARLEAWTGTIPLPRQLRALSPLRRVVALVAISVGLLALAIMATGIGLLSQPSVAAAPDALTAHPGITILTMRSAPYHIRQTLVLTVGETLQVQPGVTISFAPGAMIDLRGGSLIAQGTTQQPILLTGPENAGTWQGIRVEGGPHGEPGNLTFHFVKIAYGGVANDAAIHCVLGNVTMFDSSQNDSLGDGLRAEANCTGEVARTQFSRDGHNAATIITTSLLFHDNQVNGLPVTLP